MGRIEDLAAKYEAHIRVPWTRTVAGAQRVVMVVYEKELERAFRARKAEFEQRTRNHNHNWIEFDCTRVFAEWMSTQGDRDAFFENPEDLTFLLEVDFPEFVAQSLRKTLLDGDDSSVVALTGVGALFGFARISALIETVDRDIRGRLVVFFPGGHQTNCYRILDARDGFDYLATCITLNGSGETA